MGKRKGRHPIDALREMTPRSRTKPGSWRCDGNGLYLVTDKSGNKRWVQRLVIQGIRRDLALGSLALVSLDEAREEARRLRRIARKEGGDPRNELRKTRVTVPTFEQAARQVHAERLGGWKGKDKSKHATEWLATLERYAFPTIGEMRVSEITSAHIAKILLPIWTEIPATATRVKQRVAITLDWAKTHNHRAGENPCAGVIGGLPPQRAKTKHHAHMPHEDLPAFMERLHQNHSISALGLRFLIVTNCRAGEVAGAKWGEIDRSDPDRPLWVIPSERMKAGEEHFVPLTPYALEILDIAKQQAGLSPYIFPGRTRRAPMTTRAMGKLLDELGHTDITMHGFRGSFRSWASETRQPRDATELALAHAIGENRTERAYLHSDLFDQRWELATAWTNFLTTKPADVVSMRRRKRA